MKIKILFTRIKRRCRRDCCFFKFNNLSELNQSLIELGIDFDKTGNFFCIISSLNQLKVQSQYSPQELQVMAYCPSFEKEYGKLLQLGYMRKAKDGYLEWLKSKQSLAEYFGRKNVKGKWSDIENLFRQKRLNHALSVAIGLSKDYKILKEKLKV